MDGAYSSTSGTQTVKWSYDVFLSFRGEDTRNNFVDHLYAALNQAGIYTFKDDKSLQKGISISPELLKAIEESMVAVVVFSQNYANSCWCLEELAKIIECHDSMGQRVLPVFYDVNPSDVRKQKGSFNEAFEQHEVNFSNNIEKVKRWREALETTANLSGWDVPRTSSGREAECIKQLVRNILKYTESRPVENLIGMESRIQDMKTLLGNWPADVFIVGIWGMGGIGKTTIARSVYNQIKYEFEGNSFLEDVRENGSDSKGLKSLQEKLLSEILMHKDFNLKDCDDGICQIQRRLGRKKVLVVLDDVDNIKQLEFLAGDRQWFGPGSRILVTTRDKHLLCHAQEEYAPELLTQTQAMKLFSRYAFKANIPPKGYEELSGVVVRHTGHLPLALKVLGSYFFGRNLDFWQSALNVLVKIPHNEVNEILKLSFNGLNTCEKKIFLYITCFYKGHGIRDVSRVLDSCGFEAASGITVLTEKSLLTISRNGSLNMHDLIQEMGLSIVSESYPNTMLFVPKQIKEVMTTNAVTPFLMFCSNLFCYGPSSSFVFEADSKRLEIVEAIVQRTVNYDYRFNAEVFKSMKKLRLLKVNGRFISSEPRYFPEELRWLNWDDYPFKSLRLARGITNLVSLGVQSGRMKQLLIAKKIILTNLKFMDLSFPRSIKSFPDISGIPNLEGLNLSNCDSLLEVHQSVFHHERITRLDLSACGILKTLSPSIQMTSLQALDLHYCYSLESFPKISKEMSRLLLLNIDSCHRISPDIRLFTGLVTLVMRKCRAFFSPIKQRMQGFKPLPCLRILDLKINELVEDEFPSDMHNAWPCLEELDLTFNGMTRLPASISQLSHLKYLDLSYNLNLRELHELPPLIQVLKAHDCTALEKIGDLSNKYKWLFKISLTSCPKLLEDQENQTHLANLLRKSLLQKCAVVNHRLSITVPGSKIPKWFSNQRSGNKITLNLPKNPITKVIGVAVCCLFTPFSSRMRVPIRIQFKAPGVKKLIDMPTLTATSAKYVWIGYMSTDILENICHGFESQDFIINFKLDIITGDKSGARAILECGSCVVYKDDISGIGSWIPDYDDLQSIDCFIPGIGDLKNGRWSRRTFSDDVNEGRKEIQVLV